MKINHRTFLATTIWIIISIALLKLSHFESERQKKSQMEALTNHAIDLAQTAKNILESRLKELDNTLISLREIYLKNPKDFTLNSHPFRKSFLSDNDLLIVIVDKNGSLAYTDSVNAKPGLYLGDREYFKFFAKGGSDQFYIDQPSFGRITKRYTVPLVRPLLSKQGQFLGVIAISIKQESLGKMESQINLSSDIALTIVNMDGAVVSRSSDLIKVQGKKISSPLLKSLLGKKPTVFISEDTLEGDQRLIAHHHINNSPFIVYISMAIKDKLHLLQEQQHFYMLGGILISFILLILLVLGLNQIETISKNQTDLSKLVHKRTQELQKSKMRYRALFESTFDAILILQDREIINCNLAALRLFETNNRHDILNKDLSELSPLKQLDQQNSKEKIEQLINQAINNGALNFEWLHRRLSNNKVFCADILLSPIKTDDEILIQATIRDIDLRKKTEHDLIMAKEKAEKNERLKSAFLSNMSHEIRTPMNSIMGFSLLLCEPNLPDQDRLEYAHIINKGSTRLLNTINDILSVSRLDSGHESIKNNYFLIQDLFNELYINHLNAFKGKNIQLVIKNNQNQDPLKIFSDEQKIYQILNNLINNAFKFTSQGSVEFGYHLKENQIEFFVKDTGRGVLLENQEIIFNRFYQEDLSFNRGFEGTGLGLTISKSLVLLLKGNIWVESKKDEGSTFKFTIPFESFNVLQIKEPIKQIANLPLMENLDWSNKSILIAEDDLNNYLLLKKTLTKKTKIKIFHALNGEEAIDILKNNPEIELLIMDLKMPKMDGKTATAKIREFNPKIPIIALTAYAPDDNQLKMMTMEFNEYLTKPYTEDLILKTLTKFF